MKWELVDCCAGDMVRIRLGSVYHYGIFVSEDEVIQFGLPPTLENRAKEGEIVVCATDIDEFACGCMVETAAFDRGELKKKNAPEKIIATARARLGEGGYHIIHNNCEHFVNECVFGESRCSQEEEIRKRWANRPICDVYIGMVPDVTDTAWITPEKRRAEIEKIKDGAERRNAAFAWQLLQTAARRSFNLDLSNAGLKRKLGGKWVSESFHFDTAFYDGVAAVAVSNSAVKLALSGKETGRILKQPRVAIDVGGGNAEALNCFWVENGASALLGNDSFFNTNIQ